MSKNLDLDDSIALLKHYELDVAEGRLRTGTAMAFSGGARPEAERTITATVGAHSAYRICPVTDFLAEGLIDELDATHLKGHVQLSRAMAHVVVKLSRLLVESDLESFSLSATMEGDHYEVLPKSIAIEASSKTVIPHRLAPHAHDDRGHLHPSKTGDRG